MDLFRHRYPLQHEEHLHFEDQRKYILCMLCFPACGSKAEMDRGYIHIALSHDRIFSPISIFERLFYL